MTTPLKPGTPSLAVIVQADGGSRGNPGVAGSGAVVLNADTREMLAYTNHSFAETTTNNVAEYMGLVIGLREVGRLNAASVQVQMDSKLVVEQMAGRWKVKNERLHAYRAMAREAAAGLLAVTYEWIPRERNATADWLANEAMSGRSASPPPMHEHPVSVRYVAPAAAGSRTSRLTGNEMTMTERVRATAHLAARYSVEGDADSVVSHLLADHADDLLTIWDNLPGKTYLVNKIKSAPLTWNDGLKNQ